MLTTNHFTENQTISKDLESDLSIYNRIFKIKEKKKESTAEELSKILADSMIKKMMEQIQL